MVKIITVVFNGALEGDLSDGDFQSIGGRKCPPPPSRGPKDQPKNLNFFPQLLRHNNKKKNLEKSPKLQSEFFEVPAGGGLVGGSARPREGR